MLQAVQQEAPFAQFRGRSMSLLQACEALHVSRRTIYYLIKSGRLQTVRTPLGSQRVLIDSLSACWEKRR